MAHGLKCYLCGENDTSDTHYYCYNCIKQLKIKFDIDEDIIKQPGHRDHCGSCGQYENRRIVLLCDVVNICDHCVEEELLAYKQGV